MGVSPYYRGILHFWALNDGNPFSWLTIHLISKGVDNGNILYHAMPNNNITDPFEYTMSSVKSRLCPWLKKLIINQFFH